MSELRVDPTIRTDGPELARRTQPPPRRMRALLSIAAATALGVLTAPTASARPDPKDRAGAAKANDLFYEARSLMHDGQYVAACPKLEESLRLDYGIGTAFNLADCNEHIGKLAAAYKGYLGVAETARTKGQSKREQIARDRAKAIEPKLAKLQIDLPAPPPGAQVLVDGARIVPKDWGSAIPIEPGSHHVTVTAPGKSPWTATVSTTPSRTARLTVPRELPDAPVAVAQAPVQTTAAAYPPPFEDDFPAPVTEHASPQRTIGYMVGVIGVAGLGIGAGFGIDSLNKRRDSEPHCSGDRCDTVGVKARDDAIHSGNAATIASIAGGAALLGGLLLVLTSPSKTETHAVRAVPQVARGGGGLSIQGIFR